MIMKLALLLGYTAAALGMSMPTKDALPARATTFSSVPVEPDNDIGCEKLTDIMSLTELSDLVKVLTCEIEDGVKNNNEVCSNNQSAAQVVAKGPESPKKWDGWLATFTPPSNGNDTYSYGSTSAVVHPLTRPLLRETISADKLTGGFVAATWNPGTGDVIWQGWLDWACKANSTTDFVCGPYNQYKLATIKINGEFNQAPYTNQPLGCSEINNQSVNPYTQVFFVPSFVELMNIESVPATWQNQFKLMNGTLPTVFPEHIFGDNPCANAICEADGGKHWYECPTLLNASTTWTNFTSTSSGFDFDSWRNAFDNDKDTDPEVTTALFGANVTDAIDAANKVPPITVQTFYDLGDKLCTNPLAVRTYLWVFMDSNPFNYGTGSASDGGPPYGCDRPCETTAPAHCICDDNIAGVNKKLDPDDYGKTWATIPPPKWYQPDNRRRMGMGTEMQPLVLFFRTQ